jgi:UDP-N-acetylmuramate--alanine ligase
MNIKKMFSNLNNTFVYLIGIKGQGMTALAEILNSREARVEGSDINEVFYTDGILKSLKIPFSEGFSEEHITKDISAVIYSAAYNEETNPEIKKALDLGIPTITYPEALGLLSDLCNFSGIAGVHGKTTTTAITGTILKNLDIPVTVLVGSEVPAFNNRSTLIKGGKYMVAETCEYRRHFLNYKPDRIILTSVELDHTDYFKDLDDINSAFKSYIDLLPEGGTCIYNADDIGVQKVISDRKRIRKNICFIPYGTSTGNDFQIESIITGKGETSFALKGFPGSFKLKVPGLHNVFNTAAAIALTSEIYKENGSINSNFIKSVQKGISSFKGTRRRCEIIGEASGILFLDDYAHHPTAIYKTLKGIKEFYPGKRIIVDFMSHTYSRTMALLNEFGTCFKYADIVILNKIYSSAREKKPDDFSGNNLYNEVKKNHREVKYIYEPLEAADYLSSVLKKDDLFLTMGAGDNWKLSRLLYEKYSNFKEKE